MEDIWIIKNPLLKQYTWIKVTDGEFMLPDWIDFILQMIQETEWVMLI